MIVLVLMLMAWTPVIMAAECLDFLPASHFLSLLVAVSEENQFIDPLVIPVYEEVHGFCQSQPFMLSHFCVDLLSQVIATSIEEDSEDSMVETFVCLYDGASINLARYLVSYFEFANGGVNNKTSVVKVRALCSWDDRSISAFSEWIKTTVSLRSVFVSHSPVTAMVSGNDRRVGLTGAAVHMHDMQELIANPRLLVIPAAVFMSQLPPDSTARDYTEQGTAHTDCSLFLQDNAASVLADCAAYFRVSSSQQLDAVQTWGVLRLLDEYRYFNSSSTEQISYVAVSYTDTNFSVINQTFFLGEPDEVRERLVDIVDADTRKVLSAHLFEYLVRVIGAIFQEGLEVLVKRKVEIRVDIPEHLPLGIGSMLKAFVTIASVRDNVRIGGLGGYVLGDYGEILESALVAPVGVAPETNVTVIHTFSYRLLVLKAEENLFPADSALFNHSEWVGCGVMSNLCAQTWYSPLYYIDHLFNCSALPTPVVTRLLGGFKRLQFLPEILGAVADLASQLVEPSLGVSVRSFTAPHEFGVNVTEHHRNIEYPIENHVDAFSATAYLDAMEDVVRVRGIRTIIVAYDNPARLEPQFESSMQGFESQGIRVLLFDSIDHLSVRPLKKAAVEMLVLAKTTHLLGNKGSTFLDATYWFGECRQTVHFVNTETLY